VGEDGPTHQPVEHLAALRAIPRLFVVRPADANETAEAWKMAISAADHPTALILSRQGLPEFDRNRLAPAEGLQNGAYVISDAQGSPDILILASGSEVALAVEAQQILTEKGKQARVVSMPCMERFEQMPADYKNQILPPDVPVRLAVEAGISQGWHKYTGTRGAVISVDDFGASGKGSRVMAEYGFTAGNVVEKALELLD
jgi:transketolase